MPLVYTYHHSVCVSVVCMYCVHVFGVPVCVWVMSILLRYVRVHIHMHLFTLWSSTRSVFMHTSIILFTPNILFKRSIFTKEIIIQQCTHTNGLAESMLCTGKIGCR